jgi:hypothetical protein
MRHQIDEIVFAVHFLFQGNPGAPGWLYRQPFLYDDTPVTRIHFTKLTVKEHHKVAWDYDETGEAKYDGYVLVDDAKRLYHNQYPTASYGQLSDTANRRYNLAEVEIDERMKKRIERGVIPYDSHLLTDVLESIERGKSDLIAVPKTASRYKAAQAKRRLLVELYTRIINEFHHTYPDYELSVSWEPMYKGSKTNWPRARIVKKETVAA